MHHWLDKLTDLTALQGDESILKDALAGLAGQIGFSGYAYLSIQPGHKLVVSNYHPEWQSAYFAQGYSALDPVVRRAKSTKRAFTWTGQDTQWRLSKAERSFYAHAADFGICSGVTIPIKTANGAMSMFTLASDKPTVGMDWEVDAVDAAAAVGQLHSRLSFLQTTPSAEEPASLDPKEAIYLRWIAVGKTMEEVAEIEGVKYNSVRVKLVEAKKRFDVHTITHLTAIAIRRRLI